MADEKVDSLFFRLTEASHRLASVTPSRDRGPTVETYRLLHKRRKR
ncbi:hypothetical protein HNQ34_003311 [Anoxybacillus tepidamans]|uniref:Uncharacterized protein n=1 Tax=Anoxybacteroides tepidamans TaxID=265948 RepID=A0A7W8IT91_9BACL|nr:hypothetical protein [Anoxybacillus tepidamans]